MANHKDYPMTNDEDMQCDSVWVEFEASFIQVLSGTELSKKITAVVVQPAPRTSPAWWKKARIVPMLSFSF